MLRVLFVISLMIAAAPLRASTGPEVAKAVAGAKPLGAVTFRWLGVTLYEAVLFTPGGKGFSWAQPMALQLRYAREISRENLIKATMTELGRMEGARADHGAIETKLAQCFRDVGKGDRFTAAPKGAGRVDLYFNGSRTCTLNHPNIRERFLSIWLSDQARSTRLSRQLRGQ